MLLPKLTRGFEWDTRGLETLGELKVSAVPLPGAVWFFVPALGFLGASARRRA